MDRFWRGLLLLRSCARILASDPRLLLLTLLNALLTIGTAAALLLPSLTTLHDTPAATPHQIPYLLLFCTYLIGAFVTLFFNTALAAIVIARMQGTRLSLLDGIMIAFDHTLTIVALALLTALVGMLLRTVERSFRPLGGISAAVLGAAWSVATFLIVPVMIVESAGPAEAIERSIALVGKTWGEQAGARIGLGGAGLLFSLPGVVLLLKGFFAGDAGARIGWLVAAGVYLALLALLMATLGEILRAAIYVYAATGQVPDGFEDAGLDGTFGR